MVGRLLSAKVTRCVAVAVFPLVSLTVQVTVVVPEGKIFGASLLYVKLQLSVTVGTPRTNTQVFVVMSGGGIITGAVLSSTKTC
jgi:hypothetical protein